MTWPLMEETLRKKEVRNENHQRSSKSSFPKKGDSSQKVHIFRVLQITFGCYLNYIT